MEYNKPMDLSSFDWDDTLLIRAYDQVMEEAKSSKSKVNKANKENVNRLNTGKRWKIGDYCRAIYHEDGQQYEARILDIADDACAIEFLGYGDYEEVLLSTLEKSLGKKSRQKQRKSVKKSVPTITPSETDYSHMNDSKVDVNASARPAVIPNANPTVEQHHGYYAAGCSQQPQASVQHTAIPQQCHFNQPSSHATAVPPPPQRVGGAAHCLPPPPPPPPMPPCSTASSDPALSAMLMSWYMAGYYTGLHQKQTSTTQCPKTRCCDQHVSNHCSHCF